jgi:hypothetical protein
VRQVLGEKYPFEGMSSSCDFVIVAGENRVGLYGLLGRSWIAHGQMVNAELIAKSRSFAKGKEKCELTGTECARKPEGMQRHPLTPGKMAVAASTDLKLQSQI